MKIVRKRAKTVIHETPSKSTLETHHFTCEEMRRQIEKKAYELYLGRGCSPGRDVEDWLEAEKLVNTHSHP